MAQVWLIRNDVFDEELERGGFISVGWGHVPNLSTLDLSRGGLAEYLRSKDPDASPQRLGTQAGVLRRFHDDVAIGDVVAPRKASNLLRVGTVSGPYFHTGDASPHPHRRNVTWVVTDLSRDDLPDGVRRGLRNISTLSVVRQRPDYFVELLNDQASRP